jgi:NAD+ synthase (glutamine-hydrolysing)
MENLKVGIHQINTVTGDITGNLTKIKQGIRDDQIMNADMSIFPETAITGYMCGSLWDRVDFVDAQEDAIYQLKDYLKEIEYEGLVVVGFVDFLGIKGNGFPHLKNAAALITKTEIQVYHKQLLASADHHEDKKYFDRGTETKAFTFNLPNVGKKRIGVLICEDAWTNDHHKDIATELVRGNGAEILININQSYFYYGKQIKRQNQFSDIAKRCKVPFITVNSCGVGDILKNIVIFDGGSMIFNEKGEMIFEAPRFREFNGVVPFRFLFPTEIESPKRLNGTDCLPDYYKYQEIVDALIFEQREFFRLCGIKKAQVHISGGIDSAIVAALAVKAMGKENVVFITNPSKLNINSLKYVEHLGEKLDVKIWENPIQSIFDEFLNVHTMSFDWAELSKTGQASVQATLRTVQGIAASHQFGSGIIATGNHTEIVLGWASFHDIGSIGVHALIGDLTKVELFQIASYINSKIYEDDVIPEDLFNGTFKPAAELPDAMEDPIDYWVQSGICALLIRDRKGKKEIMEELMKPIPNFDYFPFTGEVKKYSEKQLEEQVDFAIRKMKISVYKAAQGAPIVIISPRSRGFSNRETLINYYNL